jgi:hypothetical protein
VLFVIARFQVKSTEIYVQDLNTKQQSSHPIYYVCLLPQKRQGLCNQLKRPYSDIQSARKVAQAKGQAAGEK